MVEVGGSSPLASTTTAPKRVLFYCGGQERYEETRYYRRFARGAKSDNIFLFNTLSVSDDAFAKRNHSRVQQKEPHVFQNARLFFNQKFYAFIASSIATAQATVIPTMGLLPAPIKPIISTCAGTELEPANCASECILPIVSVIP